LPAITLPVARSRNDLPLGLQLVGQFQLDDEVLQIAKLVEDALSVQRSQ
jgi:Asp-tRNA(Asn)/Glu-tRNA(Gln) amidotransferase A subunit family amidase